MGIPEYTSFLYKKYNWRTLYDCGQVIIDGNNVCNRIYQDNHTWLLGGEYAKFHDTVKDFFTKRFYIKPIVVFDGIDCSDLKEQTQRQRRIDGLQLMRNVQKFNPWQDPNAKDKYAAPLHIVAVFKDVLRELDIEFHVSDGEADRAIAALANHYKCPVLASDSDFFIFELKHGFIHFDRFLNKNYHDEDEGVMCCYSVSDFQKQFHLHQHELCLLIPLIHGNDFVPSSTKIKNYEHFLGTIAKYKSCDEYINSSDIPAGCTPESLSKNLDIVRSFYCDLDPAPYLPGGSITNPVFDALPKWVLPSMKEGDFTPHLLMVYHKRVHFLPRVVEIILDEAAWKVSGEIRQFLYGFLGISPAEKIVEIGRKDSRPMLSDDPVSPKNLNPPVSIQDIERMETRQRFDIVLAVLKCHKISEEDIEEWFITLGEEWKLPIAATFYWYRKIEHARDKEDLVKGLLLCFLACSKVIEYNSPPAKPWSVHRLHMFAKWQCVYYDAVSLNCLVGEPFETTSPAFLFSGEAATHFVSIAHKDPSLESVLRRDSDERKLFNTLLYLATGCDLEGRKGKHASRQHKPRASRPPPQPTAVQKSLSTTNRFAQLSMKTT